MIAIPIAVHTSAFQRQLDLFWFAHQQIGAQAHAVIVKRNEPHEPAVDRLQWPITIPHTMAEACFDLNPDLLNYKFHPLNVQYGLQQVLDQFPDQQLLAVMDCDMFQFRGAAEPAIGYNEMWVSPIYENWHLKSLTDNRWVISPYFENNGIGYNGGFVPLIAHAATFRKILREWILVHIDILRRDLGELISWWAGMFALQAACEKARVQMVGFDCCYCPPANKLQDSHYIGHYSVDRVFNKHQDGGWDLSQTSSPYYDMIKRWITQRIA